MGGYGSNRLDRLRQNIGNSFSLIYAKSFHMLGKIFEQKGWKGKAIEHYEKFLDYGRMLTRIFPRWRMRRSGWLG